MLSMRQTRTHRQGLQRTESADSKCAATTPKLPRPSFLGCVQIADAERFMPVRRGIRQHDADSGDFIRASAVATKCPSARANLFWELTVEDLQTIWSETASRGGGHLLLTREADPKLADAADISFPPLTPSGQGENKWCAHSPLCGFCE